MLAVTLTFSALFSVMFLILGTLVGWLAKDYVLQRDSKYIPLHPEMFDENGQIIPDEVLAVRFENDMVDPDDPLN
jgi:hypothetical protein